MNDCKTINRVLNDITKTLNRFEKDDDHGLLTGSCGRTLFYAYYYKLTGKKSYLNKVYNIIETTIKALGEKEFIYSHCSGLAGIAWCIRHLINNQILDQDTEDIFDEIDEILFQQMKEDMEMFRFDFLHQGLGIALYFLEKLPDAKARQYLEEAVSLLESAIVSTETGICWKDTFTILNEATSHSTFYNTGLAHGVPAALSILSLIYEKGIAVERTRPIIEKGLQWLVSTRNEPGTNCISLYPTHVTENNKTIGKTTSRLGWCYGDLSVGITLWNIGTRLQNDCYKREAIDIFKHTLQYRNKENGGIVDASLCHGSMGVSHLFRRVHLAAGDSSLLEGSENWLEQTLQMRTWEDAPAGFKFYTQYGYQNNYNLLEGITGIGLGLIAALDKDNAPDWDRCLLMS